MLSKQELAEAILRGCEDSYQITGSVTDNKGVLCVMGAALVGAGIPIHMAYVAFENAFGIEPHTLYSKNDNGWSREDIAFWLKTGQERIQ